MTLNILSCCCRCQTQQLNRKALSRSEPEVEAEVSASYFPKMSNLLSLRASYVYLWDCNTRMSVDFLQVCNRRYRLVRDLSKEINHPPLCSFSKHMQGVHLNSFKWVSKIFQKTNVFLFFVSFFFVWNCHSSGHCPSKTEITAQNNLFYDWYCGPQWCECTIWWMFCWLQIPGGGMWVSTPSVSIMCSVLLFRIASSKLQPRATISMHLNWSLYIILHIR